jgi:hypothetical protein
MASLTPWLVAGLLSPQPSLACGAMRHARALVRCSAPDRPAKAPVFAEQAEALPELPGMLREDIGRRARELITLSWLGRVYLLVPFLTSAILPGLFNFSAYEDESRPSCWRAGPGVLECTLCERSLVPTKGIPFTLRFEMSEASVGLGPITRATLLGVGCDLRRASAADNEEALGIEVAEELCTRLASDAQSKRLVVEAIISAIARTLPPVLDATKRGDELVACTGETRFTPLREYYGREGLNEKWVQKISGYYFAEAQIQEARFLSLASPDEATFTFYYDRAEPINGDPTAGLNINPEVICSSFASKKLG